MLSNGRPQEMPGTITSITAGLPKVMRCSSTQAAAAMREAAGDPSRSYTMPKVLRSVTGGIGSAPPVWTAAGDTWQRAATAVSSSCSIPAPPTDADALHWPHALLMYALPRHAGFHRPTPVHRRGRLGFAALVLLRAKGPTAQRDVLQCPVPSGPYPGLLAGCMPHASSATPADACAERG